MIKAVLFDLDGTLVNSLKDLADSVNFTLRQFGFAEHETEKYKMFVGDGIPKMLERALPPDCDVNVFNKVKNVFFERYSVHFADTTVPYDGMPELITALKERGIKIAVVTNKAQNMADKVVKNAYGDVFDVISGKREGVPGKPDPTTTLMVMDELGVKPSECVFLGDSKNDVLAGFNSGAYPVGELWGFRDENELLSNNAKFIIKTPCELLKVIDEINEDKK
ncbi:MAG: HAD family hydrolase [Clostridia bacterium]|nr:HAD family hydrolase [Clostridia bacterium]